MKFYEKIIGISKDAPNPELTMTFSNNGFEFNNNLYLNDGKTLSLNGEQGNVIFFRNSGVVIADLDDALHFGGNSRGITFNFGRGAIWSPNLDLGSNSIPFKKGYFSNLLSPGNLKIEAPSNSYLKLKVGGAEMILEQDAGLLLGDLTVVGKITATGKITTKESILNTFHDVYEAFVEPSTLSIACFMTSNGALVRTRAISAKKLNNVITIYYVNSSGEIRQDSGYLDDNTRETWTRYYL